MEKDKSHDLLFGLDIGTRTVIGIVGYYEENIFHIIKSACIEHEERAMLDGQIHDIDKVVRIVTRVKNDLEKQLGHHLTEVSIAAAGRVLNTQVAEVIECFDEIVEITPIHIQTLQVEGINQAQKMLEEQKGLKESDYFCVGHTVMQYVLDDYPISNLEGHKGKKIAAKVLATFLPKEVITSLYTVTQRVGLEVKQLTLEPIAAINAIIPENLRLLNLAVVDVGAGTSDLAITKDGSVVAYGMIPMAGDEVTETIVHQYLVDFHTAEKIKQQIDTHEVVHFNDIIGLPYEIASEEIRGVIAPVINQLAEKIAFKIKELNGEKPTNAVFCVGGGSQMYGLIQKISEILGLPGQRVALRSCEHIPHLSYKKNTMKGPEMITPIGICLTTAKYYSQQFTKVSFNGEDLMLLNTKKLTVLDALIEKGLKHDELFPRRGQTLMYKFNGERVRIKGYVGENAKIQLNGVDVSLDTFIQSGDTIVFSAATPGEDAKAVIEEHLGTYTRQTIFINGEPVTLPLLMANGDYVSETYQIKNQDDLEIVEMSTLDEILSHLNFSWQQQEIRVNGKCIIENVTLVDGDKIQIHGIMPEPVVAVQDDGVWLSVNGESVILPHKEGQYLFVNIFDFIDFDLTKPQGTIQLKLNGQRAAVTDMLKNGDRLQIYWEK
ncbi:MAG: cell division protein FtsA [Cellulosilyticaceae bacterium]